MLLFGPLLAAGCGDGPPAPVHLDPVAHGEAVLSFHEARVAELSAPDSWLSLIALHWLEEGETTLGGGPDNDLVLPGDATAPRVGRVTLQDSTVRFMAELGVRVIRGIDSTLSLPAGSGAFPPDTTGDALVAEAVLGNVAPGQATVLRHGPVNWILVRRGDQFALRVRDNAHPVYREFTGIDRYAVDQAWRLTARWVPHEKTVMVPNILGTASEQESPAYVEFWVDGDRHTLDVTGDQDSDRFMMVFADETSGNGTYGGGRYLWFSAPDDQNRVVLDFNLAYNPPCVWSDYATCPLPTRDNRLALPVDAGEKDWAH
ncbi:MAG: DUF1684 domain-containing protein [Gemmatimonadetes bacterium]|nr:DUF1684 domain-containing protein [Gemmatimonadota bacterium]